MIFEYDADKMRKLRDYQDNLFYLDGIQVQVENDYYSFSEMRVPMTVVKYSGLTEGAELKREKMATLDGHEIEQFALANFNN